MKNHQSFIVFVNFPWYNNRVNSFGNSDELYYRALARRTFCGYMYDTRTFKDIKPEYTGSDSLHEISRHLTGIIFIDDYSVYTDAYSCHIYLNPNAIHPVRIGRSYLNQLVRDADNRSILDDFCGDNY